jgi:hypothetical protein
LQTYFTIRDEAYFVLARQIHHSQKSATFNGLESLLPHKMIPGVADGRSLSDIKALQESSAAAATAAHPKI